MKRFSLLAISLLVFSSLFAQVKWDKYQWMNGSLVFSAKDQGDHILFNGGSCHEGGYRFILKKTSVATDFIVDCVKEDGESEYVPIGKIGDRVVFVTDSKNSRRFLVFYHDGAALDVLFPFVDENLYDNICLDMQSQLNGEYVDDEGESYVFDYSRCKLGKIVPKETDYTFGEEYDTPVNVIKVAGKNFCYELTTDGVNLYNAKYDEESDYYEKGDLFKKLKYIDKGDGRWPFTKYRIINSDILNDYSKKDLRLMRNEILARKGYVFTSKDLKDYFGSKSWYKPCEDNSKIKLTIDEQISVDIIRSAEKNENNY